MKKLPPTHPDRSRYEPATLEELLLVAADRALELGHDDYAGTLRLDAAKAKGDGDPTRADLELDQLMGPRLMQDPSNFHYVTMRLRPGMSVIKAVVTNVQINFRHPTTNRSMFGPVAYQQGELGMEVTVDFMEIVDGLGFSMGGTIHNDLEATYDLVDEDND